MLCEYEEYSTSKYKQQEDNAEIMDLVSQGEESIAKEKSEFEDDDEFIL